MEETKPSVKLAHYLAMSGIAARRKSEELILQGKVKVNGEVETKVATRVVPGKDRVEYLGEEIFPEAGKVILALNKPRGVVSTVSDPDGKPTVLDYVPREYSTLRLFPVGRLDEDSEGLILLTNDGDFSQRVTHPSNEIEKEYHVTISDRLTESEMRRIEKGVPLKDGVTQPAQIEVLKEGNNQQTVAITVTEGRYHEVRRIMKALNHDVYRLVRVRIDAYELGDLRPGSVKKVDNLISSSFGE